jgi:hypothetical protein
LDRIPIRTISTYRDHSTETVPTLMRAPGDQLPHTQAAKETSTNDDEDDNKDDEVFDSEGCRILDAMLLSMIFCQNPIIVAIPKDLMYQAVERFAKTTMKNSRPRASLSVGDMFFWNDPWRCCSNEWMGWMDSRLVYRLTDDIRVRLCVRKISNYSLCVIC